MDGNAGQWNKSEWRKRMRAVRDAMPEAEREERSRLLCERLLAEVVRPMRSNLGRPLNLCIYAAFRSEADPATLAASCIASGDSLAAPIILPNGEGMALRKVEGVSSWRFGRWGVPEPDPERTAPWDMNVLPDIVLVPGLAFNSGGGRLGYGGGYYDRLYERLTAGSASPGLWIGFAFSTQLVEAELPKEPHDLPLNGLATDEGIAWYDLPAGLL
ncbi:5-formyltetrahydrofolate cyclo-ligase [Cohnella sp. GCM10027633]|uniref:5-formyltetrahydrofolate cyclo-ligase n=1 Tax=unclassified Cohnella TaxID=2636738 RepID=UPI003627A5A0